MIDPDRLRCGRCGDELLPEELRGHLASEGRLLPDELLWLDTVREALTSEDELAHGEAVFERGGRRIEMNICAYCREEWPCHTQRGIDRLLVRLGLEPQ